MVVLGKQVLESDLQFDHLHDGGARIVYDSQEFIITPIGAARPISNLA